MKNIIIIIVVVVLVGGGIWFLSTLAPEELVIPEEVEAPEERIIEEEIIVPLGEGAPEAEETAMIKIGIKEGEEWNTFTWYEYDGYKVSFSIDYPADF